MSFWLDQNPNIMCRFLLVKSKERIDPKALLLEFAKMAENSKALDGDWQGDGWGIAWLNRSSMWERYTSLQPVWKESQVFSTFPESNIFIAHARSASFPQHKEVIEFNQPYITKDYAFVFNGLLRRVSLPSIPGKIGAEKIWYLLQQKLEKYSPQDALEQTKQLLIESSKEIIALNIGLASKNEIFSLNYFTQHPEYYQFHAFRSERFFGICSEKIDWTVAS